MNRRATPLRRRIVAATAAIALLDHRSDAGPSPANAASPPWMDTTQTPLQRANELLAAMSTTDKLA